jgi:hypothetical protein
MDNELTMQQVAESDLPSVEGGLGPVALFLAGFFGAHAIAAGVTAAVYGGYKIVHSFSSEPETLKE